jgi:Ca2+-binding RTX toxin-like protein
MPTFNVFTPTNPETLFNSIASPTPQYTYGGGNAVDAFDYGTGTFQAEGVHTRFIGSFQGYYDDEEWYVSGGTVTALRIVTDEGYPLVEIADLNIEVSAAFAQIVMLTPSAFRAWIEGQEWTFNGSAGSDTLTGGNMDDEIIAHSGADIVLGLDGDDVIEGGNGADQLTGGAGRDLLDGGKSADQLTGGQNRDTFIMATNYGKDVVHDFVNGIDRFDISDWKAIQNFKDLKANHLVASGEDVIIKAGSDWITITNTVKGDINAADFIF